MKATAVFVGPCRSTSLTFRGIVMTYLAKLPAAIPRGKVLVHNHVLPTRRLGMRGFRAWLQEPEPARLVTCDCTWASRLGAHYRVAGLGKLRKAGA